jgi:hypothetical protein
MAKEKPQEEEKPIIGTWIPWYDQHGNLVPEKVFFVPEDVRCLDCEKGTHEKPSRRRRR